MPIQPQLSLTATPLPLIIPIPAVGGNGGVGDAGVGAASVLPLQRSTTASPWAVVHHHAARRRVFAEYDDRHHQHPYNNHNHLYYSNDFDQDDCDQAVWQGWERLLHWKDGAYKRRGWNHHHHKHHRLQTTTTTTTARSSNSMPLSNCHSLLYTTNIEIGSRSHNTPSPQSFQVQLDLEGTDLWVLSADCDDSCSEIRSIMTGGGGYDAAASETSQPLYDDENNKNKNSYQTGARSGNQISGTWMQDTVALTSDIVIPKQGFAAINHIEFADELLDECQTAGAIGFGPTKEGIGEDQVVEEYATIRANLGSILPRPMFSLYLTNVDDYPVMDDNNNDDGAFHSTATASSELVLGGIKTSHYTGCLTWHDLQFINWSGDEQGDQYLLWNLALTRVSVVDDTNHPDYHGEDVKRLIDLPNADTAILVTDAMLGAGNAQSIGLYAKLNNLTCALEAELEDAIAYEPVECDDEFGLFDVVYTDRCSEQVLYPLEIAIQNADSDDSTVYKLGKDVLLIPASAEEVGMDGSATEDDDFCLLGLLPIPNVDGFLFGEGFLRQFYTVFDFGEYKIGIAPRADNDPDVCPDDADLDIAKNQPPSPASDAKSPAPTRVDNDGAAATESPAPTSAESIYPTASETGYIDDEGTPFPTMLPSFVAAPTPTSMMPPSSSGGMMPPNNTGGIMPPSSSGGMMPPSGSGMMPSGNMMPPSSSSSMHQPTSQQGRPYLSYNDDSYTSSTTSGNDNVPLIIPLVLACAVGLGALVIWRARRVRYHRAAYFEDMTYRMGDMELREIY